MVKRCRIMEWETLRSREAFFPVNEAKYGDASRARKVDDLPHLISQAKPVSFMYVYM